MKPKSSLRPFLALAGSSLLAISSASAATYYWDNNGTVAGVGSADGTTWDGTSGSILLNSDITGGGAGTPVVGTSVITTTADRVDFGNGSNGLAAGTITVSGTVNLGTLSRVTASGTITLSGGTINFANAGTIHGTGGTLVIESIISGASTSLSKTGTTTAYRFTNSDNSYTGFTSILRVASLKRTPKRFSGCHERAPLPHKRGHHGASHGNE